MIIVGIKPTPQTLYKFLKPKPASHPDNKLNSEDDRSKANIEPLSGCLAWLPVIKLGSKELAKGSKDQNLPSDPMLAFAWGNHLFILRVSVENSDASSKATPNGRSRVSTSPTPSIPKQNKKGINLEFIKVGEWKCKDAIVGIQWINRQVRNLSLCFYHTLKC